MRLFHDAAGRGAGGCQPSPRAPRGHVGKTFELRPTVGPSVGCQLGESALFPHWERPRDEGLRERRGPPDRGRSGMHHRSSPGRAWSRPSGKASSVAGTQLSFTVSPVRRESGGHPQQRPRLHLQTDCRPHMWRSVSNGGEGGPSWGHPHRHPPVWVSYSGTIMTNDDG